LKYINIVLMTLMTLMTPNMNLVFKKK
jgi:hypothetical protein